MTVLSAALNARFTGDIGGKPPQCGGTSYSICLSYQFCTYMSTGKKSRPASAYALPKLHLQVVEQLLDTSHLFRNTTYMFQTECKIMVPSKTCGASFL